MVRCVACVDLALSWNEWREHLPAAVKFYVANCTMYREFGAQTAGALAFARREQRAGGSGGLLEPPGLRL